MLIGSKVEHAHDNTALQSPWPPCQAKAECSCISQRTLEALPQVNTGKKALCLPCSTAVSLPCTPSAAIACHVDQSSVISADIGFPMTEITKI